MTGRRARCGAAPDTRSPSGPKPPGCAPASRGGSPPGPGSDRSPAARAAPRRPRPRPAWPPPRSRDRGPGPRESAAPARPPPGAGTRRRTPRRRAPRSWRRTTARGRVLRRSAGGPGVVLLHHLGVGRALAELLRLGRRGRREEPHLALQLEQLLVGVHPHLERLELLDQRVARQLFVHLRGGDELALLVLDLLGHALERLEDARVADRGQRLLDAPLRLDALLARDEHAPLALRLLDTVVQLAQRQLELLGLLAVLEPGIVELHGVLAVLVVPQQRLLGQIVAPLLDRQHRAALPLLGALALLLHLRGQPLLVRDRRRHLLLRL